MVEYIGQILAEVEKVAQEQGKPLIEPTSIMWVVGIVAAAFVMLRLTQRRVARNQADRDLSVRERVSRRAGRADPIMNQMNELMAALADMSRQINGQIDTRLAKLEILLGQAEETIGRLEKLESGDGSTNSQGGGRRNREAKTEVSQAIVEISAQFHDSVPKLSPESQEVLELVEQGMTRMAISQKLDRPIGEIDLILSLAGKKDSK